MFILTVKPIKDPNLVIAMFPLRMKIDRNSVKYNFFVKFPEHPLNQEIMASIQIFPVIKKIGLIEGYIYSVCAGSRRKLVSVQRLTKVFFMKEFSKGEPDKLESCFMIKLCSSFEHS